MSHALLLLLWIVGATISNIVFMKKIRTAMIVILFICPFFSFSQIPEFTLNDFSEIIFASSMSYVDSFLKTKNYTYKPSAKKDEANTGYVYFENINRRRYADGILVKEEPGTIDTLYSAMIVKSDDKLYEALKKVVTNNSKVKKMKEKINANSSFISYNDGVYEYNFYITNTDGDIIYSVEVLMKPSLEYYQK